MSQRNLPLQASAPSMRPRTRREKIGIALSVVGFFGSIGALAVYGIASYHAGAPDDERGPMVIFAGGAPAIDAADEAIPDAAPTADDDYVVGDFGDPVGDLYADDDEGGWGASAVESSSGSVSERGDGSGRPRPEGRIARGTGGS